MIGNRIRELRLEKGWTQSELAEKMGYKDKTAISKIEKNINDVNQSTIQKFADIFGCDVSDFFLITPISDAEIEIIMKYRKADKVTRESVNRLLAYYQEMYDNKEGDK